MNRKIMIRHAVISVVMILSFISAYQGVKAVSNVSIPGQWYSNSSAVGYWQSNPYVYITNLGNWSVVSYVNRAVNAWNNAGIRSSVTNTASNANISYYGGTKAQLNAIGFSYDGETTGQTIILSKWLAATRDGSAPIYRISSAMASTCKGSDYPVNATMHEYGHALGWYGHFPENSNMVMYKRENGVETLGSEEKYHLTRVYNVMR